MTPDFVVSESLRGFDGRKLIVIPGWRYKVLVGVMRVIPVWLQRRAAIMAARRYRRPKKTDVPAGGSGGTNKNGSK
jgi:hypothetical protein